MRKTDYVTKLPFPIKAKIYVLENERKWLEIFTIRSLAQDIYGVRKPTPSQIVSTRNLVEDSKPFLPSGWEIKTILGGKRNVYYLVHKEKYKREEGHSIDMDLLASNSSHQ